MKYIIIGVIVFPIAFFVVMYLCSLISGDKK